MATTFQVNSELPLPTSVGEPKLHLGGLKNKIIQVNSVEQKNEDQKEIVKQKAVQMLENVGLMFNSIMGKWKEADREYNDLVDHNSTSFSSPSIIPSKATNDSEILINPRVINNTPYELPKSDGNFKYRLDIIENEYPPCPNVLESLKNVGFRELKRYPYNSQEYQDLLTGLVKYTGCQSSDQIIITHGSDNALRLICDTYLTPYSNVLIPIPTYPHLIKFV